MSAPQRRIRDMVDWLKGILHGAIAAFASFWITIGIMVLIELTGVTTGFLGLLVTNAGVAVAATTVIAFGFGFAEGASGA